MKISLNIKAAFSPCPNDFFLFYPWKEKKINTHIHLDLHTFDINILNMLAQAHAYPLIKISAAVYPKVMKYYEILPVGVTTVYNKGPLVITSMHNKTHSLDTLAAPGKDTTAYKLFNRYFYSKNCVFLNFRKILPAVHKQHVKAGLLIHESRFNLSKEIYVLADLGKLWQQETTLPLPLGCIVIARHLSSQLKQNITAILKDCFSYSQSFLENTILCAKNFAQEKNTEIIKKFINTYVSSETHSLSAQGILSLEYFWNQLPSKFWLFHG